MIVAFFDIDGTIYRNSLLAEHFKKLIKYELLDLSEYKDRVEEAYNLWDQRVGDYDKYLLGLTGLYVDALKGMPLSYNDFISDQVVYLKGNRVYKYTRDRIKWHKDQGHKVIFISGSPDFLVSRMAKKFGADHYCASSYHVNEEDQTFSGEISPMWDSVHKMEAIEELKKLYSIDFEESYAYGDTNGDYSMLLSVGHPKAINPSRELIIAIKENEELSKKTEIIIERKDVIYKLNADVEIL